MQNNIKVGSVVLSTAGHDSGNYFVVVEIESDNYVKICDGKLRKLDKPKRKKIKHLKDTFVVIDELANKFEAKEVVHDKNIEKALKAVLK